MYEYGTYPCATALGITLMRMEESPGKASLADPVLQ